MKRTSLFLVLALVVASTFALAACSTPEPTAIVAPTAEPTTMAIPTEMPTPAPALADMLTTIKDDGRFTDLLKLIGTAGVTDTLTGPGPITLLAPTDEAFAALPAGTLDNLTLAQAKDIVDGLLIGQKILSSDVTAAPDMKLDGVTMKAGTVYSLTSDGTTVTVDGKAKITQADIETMNGVIQVIDVALMPTATQ